MELQALQILMASLVVAFAVGVGVFIRAGRSAPEEPEAAKAFKRVAKPSGPPPKVEDLLRTADGCIREGDLDRASLLLAQASSIEPDRPGLLFVRSRLLHAQGELTQAIKVLEQACRGRPDVAAWHGVRGSLLLELKRPDLAVQAFEQVVELSPDDPNAQEALAEARRLMG